MNQMMWDPAQGQYQTLKVRTEGSICFVQFYRPDANNTINDVMLAEMNTVLGILAQNSHPSQPRSADDICIVVFEGLPEVFCYGADFNALAGGYSEGNAEQQDPEFIYNVWQQMATGPFVTVAHVRGKVNAGGVGFVAACDIVLSDTTATFALSELLFGLIPACVMPFLVRKIGFQKAHYLTTSTQPINVQTAADWGLVDVYDENSAQLLRKQLLRLRRLSRKTIGRYKTFMNNIQPIIQQGKPHSLQTNLEVFGDEENLAAINRFVTQGIFPWE